MAKSGRPRKDSIALPEWFNIQKYAGMRDMGAAGWHEQLLFRGKILIGISDCEQSNDKEYKQIARAWEMLQNDPIITEQRVRETRKVVVESETEHEEADGTFTTIRTGYVELDPVIGATLHSIHGAGLKVLTVVNREDITPHVCDEENNIVANTTFNEDGSCTVKDPPLTWRGRPIVAIDPTLTDKVLHRELRHLLREMRKTEKAPVMEFTKNSDFSKWYNSGALPFLDLSLWGLMGHDFKGSAFVSELSDILDNPIGSESAALKAALTYAKKLLTPQTLRVLAAQAIREGQSGTEKSGKFLVT